MHTGIEDRYVVFVYFLLIVVSICSQCRCNKLPGKSRFLTDLLPVCVKWDVKLYSLTHSRLKAIRLFAVDVPCLTGLLEMCRSQSKLSQLQQLQQKTEMELLDAQMFSASLENELEDEDGSGIVSYIIF